jgi:hypothetical protein
MGDERFVPEAGVVLVHRVRAEHIVRALGPAASVGVLATAPPAPEPVRLTASTVAGPVREARSMAVNGVNRWRDIWGWLGIVAAACVFVAALATPLDDPALVMALMLAVRGGRMILDADSDA